MKNKDAPQLYPANNAKFAWFIWALAATFYFTDYMARVAPSVMHRELQIDFGMKEIGFSLLTASFYIPYVIMQIPVGIIIDRISIRVLLTIMALITAIGCLIFGLSYSLGIASCARILIGFSAAFAFISALRLATSWFPPAKLGLLAGLTQALGMLGASAGQAPLSFLVSAVGWRHSMLVIAVVFAILAILLYLYIQDKPNAIIAKRVKPQTFTILQSLSIVLSSRRLWINALYAGFLYAPTAVIGESMGPAYLQYGRGLSAHTAAFAVGLIFMGWVIGGPITGWFSDRTARRQPFMLLSAICGIIFTSILLFDPIINRTMVYILFFCYGLTNTGVAIAYAVATEFEERKVVGTAIAFTNMLSILIGACMQPLVAYLIDRVAGYRGYDVKTLLLSDFQAGLWILPCCLLIALILAFFVHDKSRREK